MNPIIIMDGDDNDNDLYGGAGSDTDMMFAKAGGADCSSKHRRRPPAASALV
ncbi:hypothetical protein PO883_04400 [Massilia sp. DJPM01]|uniref:hypothetical protein n=1 Tax=Massilia sp. DJPM01 TaxID=3024404 RepID=UPI00259F8E81|nr:hypothetical protein [Massilia sp. DJPM01]MDM5176433.1 hypothetical protein [Massilia sp. DJPM01]